MLENKLAIKNAFLSFFLRGQQTNKRNPFLSLFTAATTRLRFHSPSWLYEAKRQTMVSSSSFADSSKTATSSSFLVHSQPTKCSQLSRAGMENSPISSSLLDANARAAHWLQAALLFMVCTIQGRALCYSICSQLPQQPAKK